MLVILGFAIVKVNVSISSLMEDNTLCPLISGLFLLPRPISLQPFSGSEVDLVFCSSLVIFQLSPCHLPDEKGRGKKSLSVDVFSKWFLIWKECPCYDEA